MADIKELIELSFSKEVLKKLVFSKPDKNDVTRITARLCAHRSRRILAVEYALPTSTVAQRNVREDELSEFLAELIPQFAQINLITTLGDAEYRRTKRGELTLGADKLLRKLSGESADFERAVGELDRQKRRMLCGSEEFLIKLGISDAGGRVHDKKQGKFRQINKFLEYVDEVYGELPSEGELTVFDLCCGKSYLSFAVYYYLTEIKKRSVYMLGIDLKSDVMEFCGAMARQLGFNNMHFITDDITNTPKDRTPDMVISLHACDVATDIVLDTAVKLSAKVILSTPCCQRELSRLISAPTLGFVTKYPKLRRTLCDALTDALRLERLAAFGYEVNATELVDPEDTPKNTLLRAIRRREPSAEAKEGYGELLEFLLGGAKDTYIGKI